MTVEQRIAIQERMVNAPHDPYCGGRGSVQCDCRKADFGFLIDEVDRLEQELERYRWRPIAEIHEDFGPCVLMHLDDPGNLEIGTNLDIDFVESEWTHFTQITPLTHDEAEAMRAQLPSAALGLNYEKAAEYGED